MLFTFTASSNYGDFLFRLSAAFNSRHASKSLLFCVDKLFEVVGVSAPFSVRNVLFTEEVSAPSCRVD